MMEPIWSHRWAVLEHRMKNLEKTLEGEQPPQPSSPSPSPTRTLYHLSQCLRFFATNQYHFFAEGFRRGYLKEIPEYPLDLVFRGIINQAFLLRPVRRGRLQRPRSTLSGDPSAHRRDAHLEAVGHLLLRAFAGFPRGHYTGAKVS